MEKIEIKIVNLSKNQLPKYETEGASGMDLRANIDEPVTLEPLERRMIPTGIYLSIPKGYEAQVRPRSGLSIKKGITCVNAVGTIDSDYRGDVGVLLVNLSRESYTIEPGERIAQMVFSKHEVAKFKELNSLKELDETERSEGGFGSTGSN